MTQSAGQPRNQHGRPTGKPTAARERESSVQARAGSVFPITGRVHAWATLLLDGEGIGWWDGGAGAGPKLRGDGGASWGRKGAGGRPEGQVRLGPAVPEGEGCLATAAITHLGGQFPFSFLIYCLLWRGEAHSLNFKGRSE